MNTQMPKYLVVENKIEDAIVTQKITGKLPGERVLAKQYGVSYMTLRRSIDNLVNKGLLYKIPAQGTFVCEAVLPAHQQGALKAFLRKTFSLFKMQKWPRVSRSMCITTSR